MNRTLDLRIANSDSFPTSEFFPGALEYCQANPYEYFPFGSADTLASVKVLHFC